MKKFFAFLCLAFLMLTSLFATAKTTVQHNMDKNVYLTTEKVVICNFISSPTLEFNILVRDLGFTNYNYSTPYSIKTKIYNKINNKTSIWNNPFVPNKDVVWLTNIKSK
jgi:hypothetical protein